MFDSRKVQLKVNGVPTTLTVAPNATLLNALRDDLGLTGTVEGCGVGVCGSCTVLVDDRPISSCIMLAANAAGRSLTTIEGLTEGPVLSTVQQAFLDAQAFQCGFCTPGMIMAVEGLLRETPKPTEAEIRHFLSGNLCRCGTYSAVIAATLAAAEPRRESASTPHGEEPAP